MSAVTCVLEARAGLGESPQWCPEEQALYWVDAPAPAIHRFAPESGETRSWPMPEPIGSFALRANGGAVAALASGFALVDLESGTVAPLEGADRAPPGARFNDGKCDRRGRFWAGTMDRGHERPLGALYRLDADRRSRRVLEGIVVSNGLGWSPDDRIMYHTDSASRRINAYDFDADAGTLANGRVFAEIPDGTGFPDGLTVDSDGFVWSVVWLGGRVLRFAPDGRLDRTVEMPVKRPTSCIFGGPELDVLYVTSASVRFGKDEPEAPPAGALFAIDAGVRGLPEPRFAG